MLNFDREYFTLTKDRYLYQTKFTDKSKCVVYGRKKFITETGREEISAHVFEISKDFWTFNAGNLDFTNYPNGIWNDYLSVDIIQKTEYTNPRINFGSMGDITPENLQALSDHLTKHLSDLEKRIVEDYLYIDEGVPYNLELPNLPENHFWVRKNGVIVGVNLDYLKEDYDYYSKELEKEFNYLHSLNLEKIKSEILAYYNNMKNLLDENYTKFLEKLSQDIKDTTEVLNNVLSTAVGEAKSFYSSKETTTLYIDSALMITVICFPIRQIYK